MITGYSIFKLILYTEEFVSSIEGTGADRRYTVLVSLRYKTLRIFIGSRDWRNKTTRSRSGYYIYHSKSNSAEECCGALNTRN